MDEREKVRADKIHLMIVDDHQLVRDGIKMSVEDEDDIQVIGECNDGESAVRMAAIRRPDVVILDVNLPNANGLQVAKVLHANHENMAIIVLTGYDDIGQVLHALKAGAQAYCRKDAPPETLVQTIRDVAHGYYVIDNRRMDTREVQAWYQQKVQNTAGVYAAETQDAFGNLSPREMEILKCVTNGQSNKEIARRLKISQQTVKNHMTSILKKLNVQDRTQAAVMALNRGWVRVEKQNSSNGNV
jgi:RNA polymerase sigma factor (sigma-70 family)